jgi:hypothetical protein
MFILLFPLISGITLAAHFRFTSPISIFHSQRLFAFGLAAYRNDGLT